MRVWRVFGCIVGGGVVLVTLYAVFSDLSTVQIRQRKFYPRYKMASLVEKTSSSVQHTEYKISSSVQHTEYKASSSVQHTEYKIGSSVQHTDDFQNQSEILPSSLSPAISSRILQLQSGCQKLRDEGLSFSQIPRQNLKHLIVNDEHQVLYCYIPKVACTNLKRVFLLLTGKMNETEPLKLKSSDVHLTYTPYLTFLHTFSEEEILYKIKNYRKVIFVREPLERLLSAYRNKFRQKGGAYFQERFGRKIIRQFRDNPSQDSLGRGHDVEFSEFVKFLLDPKMEPRGFNEHWAPMSSLCHPCHISYDFIGKYESLDDDVTLLLKEMSVIDRINFPERGDTYKTERTEDTMTEYFKTIDTKYLKDLWTIYLHDYILFGYPFPEVIRDLLRGQTHQ